MQELKFNNIFLNTYELSYNDSEENYFELYESFKFLYEVKNENFINLLKTNKLQKKFQKEVSEKLINMNHSLSEFNSDFIMKKLGQISGPPTSAVYQMNECSILIYLYYWLRSPKIYEVYILLLQEFIKKHNLNIKISIIISETYEESQIKNYFYESLIWNKKTKYNYFQQISPNSYLMSEIAINHNYYIFRDFYKHSVEQKIGGRFKYVNEPDFNTKYQLENNFMYKLDVVNELKRKNLKTYFLWFANYENWISLQEDYSKILPNHDLNWKNYELDFNQIKILNEKEFLNSFIQHKEFKLWNKMHNECNELPTNCKINLVIGIMGTFKVSFNYAIYLTCSNYEFYINNQEIINYVLSLYYYYNLIDNILSKLGLKGNNLYDDLNIKSESLRNYTQLNVKEYKYK